MEGRSKEACSGLRLGDSRGRIQSQTAPFYCMWGCMAILYCLAGRTALFRRWFRFFHSCGLVLSGRSNRDANQMVLTSPDVPNLHLSLSLYSFRRLGA